jgi:hypothetical protein
MTSSVPEPTIPESFLECRQSYASVWVDRWTATNPFIRLLFPLLRNSGVELTDFRLNKDTTNLGDTYLQIAVRKLNAAIRIGLDSVTYLAGNPDWSMAPHLVDLFDRVSAGIQKFVGEIPTSQQMTFAFHVTSGEVNLHEKTAQLVNQAALGEATFYGLSLYHEHGSTVIDKSLRYESAAFIRLQRRFGGTLTFAEIAPQIYEDEVKTLELLGIRGIA